ncbi:protein atonal homolog 8 isoform X2 [Venturia canescens]|nr:protein atonal homolog 8-like isoform X2 [Venturia canescens]
MAANSERDAGFCSGGDEDDNMSGLHSPSASEDSVEVQVTPISLRNKRKLAEPRKIQEPNMAPLKKRRFELVERTTSQKAVAKSSGLDIPVIQDEESRPAGSPSPSPFRPWSSPATTKGHGIPGSSNKDTSGSEDRKISRNQEDSRDSSRLENQDPESLRRHEDDRWIEEENKRREEETRRRYEARIQEEVMSRLQESDNRRLHHRHHHHHHHNHLQNHDQRQPPLSPLSPQLVATPPRSASANSTSSSTPRRESRGKGRFETAQPTSLPPLPVSRLQEEPLSLVLRSGEPPRVPSHPGVNGSYERSPAPGYASDPLRSSPHHQNGHRTPSTNHSGHPTSPGQSEAQQQQQHHQQQQRNYKNMTRERRIEANARERTRVHTISAAFDTLRRAVPAYSNNQKLSKLSVLRIACSYIMTLSNIANTPEGEPTTSASLGACVDLVSRTIQTEGKLRKKKDD